MTMITSIGEPNKNVKKNGGLNHPQKPKTSELLKAKRPPPTRRGPCKGKKKINIKVQTVL
jgi:hypothetical protein